MLCFVRDEYPKTANYIYTTYLNKVQGIKAQPLWLREVIGKWPDASICAALKTVEQASDKKPSKVGAYNTQCGRQNWN